MSFPSSDPRFNVPSPMNSGNQPQPDSSSDFLAGLSMEMDAETRTAPLQSPSTLTGEAKITETVTNAPSIGRARMLQIPGFEVQGELGRGAMGVVYKAKHLSLKRIVAIKMVLDCALNNPKVLQRFYDEAEAVGRLQHHGIVQIFNSGEFDGLPYFCLEYIDGHGLELDKGKLWDYREAAQIVIQLCEALHYAHSRGIVHRDMKPANVLLTSQGKPKITDFGLAKFLSDDKGLTASGAIMGTPGYMAPEQAAPKKEEPIGPAADVYALGAILYEMVTGHAPFEGATALDTVMQVLTADPKRPKEYRPDVPKDVEAIIMRCLRKKTAERYPSAETLAADLRRFLNGEAVRAKGPSTLGRFKKQGKKGGSLFLYFVILILLAALGGLGYWYWITFFNK
jgi:eukaryotic-like serine/threonine-protein kinase